MIVRLAHVLLLSESAATLEAESGYTMETPDVSMFRQCILYGDWTTAEELLGRLGFSDEEGLWVSLQSEQSARDALITPCSGCEVPYQSAEIPGVSGGRKDYRCSPNIEGGTRAIEFRPGCSTLAV